MIGCFGLTEPDHGSDPGGMETRARRDGRGWVLNGTKRWITNGSIADVAIVWAKVDEGFAGFLVEKGKQGFATHNIKGKFSMRASITSELIFDDVRLDDAARLPEARGLRAALGLPDPGALRDRLGRDRRRALVLPMRAGLRQVAQAVQPPARRLPAGAEQAGHDADRNHQGADGLHAPGPSQGPGQDAPGAGFLRQAQQRGSRRWRSRGWRATCSAPTGSSTSTR